VESLGLTFFRASKEAKAQLDKAMTKPTPLAHWVAANLLASQGKYQDAVVEARRALTLDSNNATGYAALANALIFAGNAADGTEVIQTAMRLDPLYPASYLVTLGQAQFALERFRDAAATLERAVNRNPENEWGWLYLAATYGHLGRTEDGQVAVETFNELRWQRGLGELTSEYVEHGRFGRRADRDRLQAGLAKVPESDWQSLITRGLEGYEVQGAPSIDAATAKALHERGALFVNMVGRYGDWMESRIPGSVWLPPHLVSQARLRELVDKDREVVFYVFAAGPLSSAQAAAKAITWGYENVHYFRGGTSAWRAAGYPVEEGE
jgi:tetratricopeptide (TPR) repeat protein